MSDPHPDKSTRVLSCVLCQQRKVRCDRTFPCTNCVKSQAQCVPAGLLPRRRKRRFPERELLDRVRQYETLLKRHDIEFNPLHGEPPREGDERQKRPSVEPEGWQPPSSSATPRPKLSKESYEAKDFWSAMNQTCPQSDDEADSPPPTMTEEVVRKAWDQKSGLCDPLFGGRADQIDLSSQHPEPSQIFRLWQTYLDNVDPLLKITHTPSLQARIVEAITNLKQIDPQLEVLMFGIYCIAIGSLMSDECQALLGAPREELLSQYQHSCREALVRCEFLRSDRLDCLTGLYFYLVSLRPVLGDPRTLSSMLGIAVRSAQRMGLHSESACSRYPPLEAELRRRLWWALVLFDTRVAEMAAYRTTTLTPLWDCKIPSNLNDFDIRPEMKEAPEPQGQSSEAVFVVVRSVMGDFLRNSSFHLDFTCPPLKAIARDIHDSSNPEASELDTLENLLVQRYLRTLNPENPLHFMTLWMTRGMLANDYYSKYGAGNSTKAQRDMAISLALEMIDCDTKLLLNPSTSRYLWLVHFHFPFPAYIHILQDLRRRPLSQHSEKCWASMSDNFEARAHLLRRMSPRLLLGAMTAVLFQAWESTEAALRQSGQEAPTPKIITIGRELVAQNQANQAAEKPSGSGSAAWPTSMNQPLPDPLSLMGMGGGYGGPEMWMPFDLPAQMSGTNILSPSDWSLINWGM